MTFLKCIEQMNSSINVTGSKVNIFFISAREVRDYFVRGCATFSREPHSNAQKNSRHS